jgi:hypothetical protein
MLLRLFGLGLRAQLGDLATLRERNTWVPEACSEEERHLGFGGGRGGFRATTVMQRGRTVKVLGTLFAPAIFQL